MADNTSSDSQDLTNASINLNDLSGLNFGPAWADSNQFKENKAVYCFKAKDILESNCRLNGRIGAHLMPETRSIDVDTLNDFELAELVALNEGN